MNEEFRVHMLNKKGKIKATAIASKFSILLNGLNGICPDGRLFSITKTKLEEACFFAKKAMAEEDINTEILE